LVPVLTLGLGKKWRIPCKIADSWGRNWHVAAYRGFTLGHRPKPVIAIQCLIAKAAHPATLQYACTVLKKGTMKVFFFFL
jgi:hypothetical protein